MAKAAVRFTLNGSEVEELVESGTTLLGVLRDKLGETSVKGGCLQGTCGACSVIIDGTLKLSCLTLAESLDGAHVETVAALARGGALHPLQRAFVETFATQCGFCTGGMLMAAKALLDHNATPSREEVIEAIAGNICRCTGYEPIIQAILAASRAAAPTAA